MLNYIVSWALMLHCKNTVNDWMVGVQTISQPIEMHSCEGQYDKDMEDMDALYY